MERQAEKSLSFLRLRVQKQPKLRVVTLLTFIFFLRKIKNFSPKNPHKT
jgi:hypothetical protein